MSEPGCEILVQPEPVHYCNPGWEKRWHEQADPPDSFLDMSSGWYLHPLDLPAGTVVRCECGQVWIAKAMWPGESPGLVMHRVHWRKPTWRERRRLRKHADGSW